MASHPGGAPPPLSAEESPNRPAPVASTSISRARRSQHINPGTDLPSAAMSRPAERSSSKAPISPKITEGGAYEMHEPTGPLPADVIQTESGETPKQAPVDPKQARRAELKAYLEDPDRYRFDDGLDLVQQLALQEQHLDWKADVFVARRRDYGDDYQLGEDMSPRYAEGFLNAMFESLCGGISSSLRSPPRNAAATAFAPKPSKDPNAPPERPLGELAFAVDAMTIGGVVGGTGSFFAEKILLPALAEVAARHNLPKMKAVDMAALSPTPPKGVPRLIVSEGPDGRRVKRFYVPTGTEPAQGRSGLGKVPTEREVRAEAERQQWWIDFARKSLEEQNLGALFAPVTTGLANAARRRAMSEAALNAWDAVLGTSMLASGGAGAASKFALTAIGALTWSGLTARPGSMTSWVAGNA